LRLEARDGGEVFSSLQPPVSSLDVLSVAHSPDPDDAFMFYGIVRRGLAGDGVRIRHVLKDIESLNRDAARGRWHVTAISAAAYPGVADKYRILSVGASVGRRYGPVVVARPDKARRLASGDWSGLRVATPGPRTTALLLLRLFRGRFTAVNTPFDRILDAVKKGAVDAGLLIHEGQITYRSHGLVLVADLGKWWFAETGLPIPLGLDVVRRDLGPRAARGAADLLTESIREAGRREKDALAYALKFGRGIPPRTGLKFVRMYVNEDTLDMGKEGERALRELYDRAFRAGLITRRVRLDVARPSASVRRRAVPRRG
jgi:1,4-dihydroxy-6-naphthoate synthase